ncbi:hypothetical protein C8R43DRAFT_980281 [Mycena crocata]|nr:hypothetical protein C8R43DRAFT_980281 [Mycena crocata]
MSATPAVQAENASQLEGDKPAVVAQVTDDLSDISTGSVGKEQPTNLNGDETQSNLKDASPEAGATQDKIGAADESFASNHILPVDSADIQAGQGEGVDNTKSLQPILDAPPVVQEIHEFDASLPVVEDATFEGKTLEANSVAPSSMEVPIAEQIASGDLIELAPSITPDALINPSPPSSETKPADVSAMLESVSTAKEDGPAILAAPEEVVAEKAEPIPNTAAESDAGDVEIEATGVNGEISRAEAVETPDIKVDDDEQSMRDVEGTRTRGETTPAEIHAIEGLDTKGGDDMQFIDVLTPRDVQAVEEAGTNGESTPAESHPVEVHDTKVDADKQALVEEAGTSQETKLAESNPIEALDTKVDADKESLIDASTPKDVQAVEELGSSGETTPAESQPVEVLDTKVDDDQSLVDDSTPRDVQAFEEPGTSGETTPAEAPPHEELNAKIEEDEQSIVDDAVSPHAEGFGDDSIDASADTTLIDSAYVSSDLANDSLEEMVFAETPEPEKPMVSQNSFDSESVVIPGEGAHADDQATDLDEHITPSINQSNVSGVAETPVIDIASTKSRNVDLDPESSQDHEAQQDVVPDEAGMTAEDQSSENTDTSRLFPVQESEIERPKSPWTPSYSVTTQGPGISASDEEEIAELPVLPPPVEMNTNDLEPLAALDSAETPGEPTVTVTGIEDGDIEPEATPSSDSPRPKSPWTPSYSVVVQGSPRSALDLLAQEDPVQEDPVEEEPAQEGLAQEESVREEHVQEEPVQEEPILEIAAVADNQPSAQDDEHVEVQPEPQLPDAAVMSSLIDAGVIVDPSTLQDSDVEDDSADPGSEAVVAALIDAGVLADTPVQDDAPVIHDSAQIDALISNSVTQNEIHDEIQAPALFEDRPTFASESPNVPSAEEIAFIPSFATDMEAPKEEISFDQAEATETLLAAAQSVPERPWTPSYSVSRQGWLSSEDKPESTQAPPSPPQFFSTEQEDSIKLDVSALEAPLDQPRASSPWTPSYSVSVQGSPLPVSLELKDAGLQADTEESLFGTEAAPHIGDATADPIPEMGTVIADDFVGELGKPESAAEKTVDAEPVPDLAALLETSPELETNSPVEPTTENVEAHATIPDVHVGEDIAESVPMVTDVSPDLVASSDEISQRFELPTGQEPSGASAEALLEQETTEGIPLTSDVIPESAIRFDIDSEIALIAHEPTPPYAISEAESEVIAHELPVMEPVAGEPAGDLEPEAIAREPTPPPAILEPEPEVVAREPTSPPATEPMAEEPVVEFKPEVISRAHTPPPAEIESILETEPEPEVIAQELTPLAVAESEPEVLAREPTPPPQVTGDDSQIESEPVVIPEVPAFIKEPSSTQVSNSEMEVDPSAEKSASEPVAADSEEIDKIVGTDLMMDLPPLPTTKTSEEPDAGLTPSNGDFVTETTPIKITSVREDGISSVPEATQIPAENESVSLLPSDEANPVQETFAIPEALPAEPDYSIKQPIVEDTPSELLSVANVAELQESVPTSPEPVIMANLPPTPANEEVDAGFEPVSSTQVYHEEVILEEPANEVIALQDPIVDSLTAGSELQEEPPMTVAPPDGISVPALAEDESAPVEQDPAFSESFVAHSVPAIVDEHLDFEPAPHKDITINLADPAPKHENVASVQEGSVNNGAPTVPPPFVEITPQDIGAETFPSDASESAKLAEVTLEETDSNTAASQDHTVTSLSESEPLAVDSATQDEATFDTPFEMAKPLEVPSTTHDHAFTFSEPSIARPTPADDSDDVTNEDTPIASQTPLPTELPQAFPLMLDTSKSASASDAGSSHLNSPPISPRSRLESTASSMFFPGGWFSKMPEGRASLDVAQGEFTPSKPTSPPLPPPADTEQNDQSEEKKGKWCLVM